MTIDNKQGLAKKTHYGERSAMHLEWRKLVCLKLANTLMNRMGMRILSQRRSARSVKFLATPSPKALLHGSQCGLAETITHSCDSHTRKLWETNAVAVSVGLLSLI